jgi:hypothetical protein
MESSAAFGSSVMTRRSSDQSRSGTTEKQPCGKRTAARARAIFRCTASTIGGLYPSANVAAQAGAIDPAQAAAAVLAGGAGPGTDVELRVQRVRRLAGSCPQP